MSVHLSLPEIARALGGKVSGRQVVAPGPNHSGRDRSLAIVLSFGSPDGFIVHPHSPADDWRECRDYVRSRLGLDRQPFRQVAGREQEEQRRAAKRDEAADRARRIVRARRLWGQAINPRNTVVETYLRSRGLDLPADVGGRVIRFHGACPWGQDDGTTGRVLAVVTAMRDLRTDELVAVHRTALTPEGEKIERRMLGPSGGAAVKIDEEGSGVLTVGEGVESCLAARQFGLAPIWALGSVGEIERLPILPGIATLRLLEERDASGASRRAVKRCTARWADRGREVVSILPSIGSDMNDALRASR